MEKEYEEPLQIEIARRLVYYHICHGFRAGFMHHKLQCHIHDLHLQMGVVYHCSLFVNFIIHHFF